MQNSGFLLLLERIAVRSSPQNQYTMHLKDAILPFALCFTIWLVLIYSGCSDNTLTDRSPEAEMSSFRFADPDLRISLVASEPDVISPVDMAWAPDGSLFVVEMPGYPTTEDTGRIKKLTDPDGDGRYHLASVFTSDLNFATSVLPYQDGILVTDAPDILFFRDTDADGIADSKEVVLTGFVPGNTQYRANSLYWGLDNWIYGANGRGGGSISFSGDSNTIAIDNRDFRFNLKNRSFEAISGLSQFGLAQDNWGNRFISINHRFAQQVVLEERYLDRNPTLTRYSIFDTEQNEHDRRVYTLLTETLRFNRDPIGYFTSLSGLSAYRGHLLGPSYANTMFAGESVQAAVISRKMHQEGVTFTAIDQEAESEFLASPDEWFHPVNFSDGPDGALYMVDFYRLFVEHPEWAHDDLSEGVDWRVGHNNGRIWRIAHKDAPREASRMKPDLHQASAEVLVSQLTDSAGWRRDMAQQLIVDGNLTQAAPHLEKVLHSILPFARVQALWTLNGLNLLAANHIAEALNDSVPQVQVQGIRLAEDQLTDSGLLRNLVTKLVRHPNQLIRFKAILALGAINSADVKSSMLETANMYRDSWTRVALLSSTSSWGSEFSRDLLATAKDLGDQDPETITFFRQLGAMVSGVKSDQATDKWIMGLTASNAAPDIRESAFLAGYLETKVSLGYQLPTFSRNFFSYALALARNENLGQNAQIGVELLRYSQSKDVLSELMDLVLESQNNDVKIAGLHTVAALDMIDLSKTLFENLTAFDPLVRKTLISSSLSSLASAHSLLTAIEGGQIGASEIPEEVRHALMIHSNENLKNRANEILGSAVNADRQAIVDRYLTAIGNRTVNLSNGAAIFTKNCASCHAINGVGGQLAPDLTNIGNRSDEVLMVSILDPSRMVSYELRLYVVVTKSGEVYSGRISTETVKSITIRQVDGQEHSILRDNIKEFTMTDQSIMPEGFERMIDEQGMADLIGFLRQPIDMTNNN